MSYLRTSRTSVGALRVLAALCFFVLPRVALRCQNPSWERVRAPIGRAQACLGALPDGRLLLFGGREWSAGALGDAWFRGRTAWEPRLGAVLPAARRDAAMALDPLRGELVLFGGETSSGWSAETWVYDGADWQLRKPSSSPPGWAGRLAWHGGRQELIWVGAASASSSCQTWSWDGQRWQQLALSGAPLRGTSLGLAYDEGRGELVLFGGAASTWTWNGGGSWRQHLAAPMPSARSDFAMAYEPATGRVVLFGGWIAVGSQRQALGDLWDWDGAQWTQRSVSSGPLPRSGAAAFRDPAGKGVYLYGGEAQGLDGHFADLWFLDAGGFRQLDFEQARPWEPLGLVRDTRRGCLVAVVQPSGGSTLQVLEFDGLRWTAPLSSVAPPTRSSCGLAYDAARGRVLLYGGYRSGYGRFGDTWDWDGKSWTLLQPQHSPGLRSRAAMAHDAVRGRVVLFDNGQTWEWDGSDWTQVPTTRAPLSTVRITLVEHPGLGQVLAYGGHYFASPSAPSYPKDIWAWTGKDWQMLATGPSGRDACALVWDAPRQRLLILGGYTESPYAGQVSRNDVWSWDGKTLQREASLPVDGGAGFAALLPGAEGVMFAGMLRVSSLPFPQFGTRVFALREAVSADVAAQGAACAPGLPEPLLAAGAPLIGHAGFAFELSCARPNAPTLFALGTAFLSTPIAPACTWELGVSFVACPAATDGRGAAQLALPIPAQAGLRGFTLAAQSLILDPRAALGMTWSRGRSARIGY
jgi:hypothetical protein